MMKKIIIFNFKDSLRQDSKEIIEYLNHINKNIILLSGDRKEVVQDIAKQLDIKEYYWDKTPLDKCQILKSLQKKHG